ncbi:MAG: metallophosphoesterase [Balneolaceae bacterium]
MLIGIISDTHDHVPHIKKAVSIFKDAGADKVIHAGDYCSPFTIHHFRYLNLHGIFGNNDGDKFLLMKKFNEIGGKLYGEFYEFEEGELKIAVYHGTYESITESLERSGKYDFVISGHTHQARLDTIGNTIAINPGSAHGFENEPMVAMLNTDTRKVEFRELIR